MKKPFLTFLLFSQALHSFTFDGFARKIVDGATAFSNKSPWVYDIFKRFNVEDFTQHDPINPLEDSYWNHVSLNDQQIAGVINKRFFMTSAGMISLLAGALYTIDGIKVLMKAKKLQEVRKGVLFTAGGAALLAVSAYLFKTAPSWEEIASLSDTYFAVLPRK